MPEPEHIVRAVNRHRQKMRPNDPTDLDFELHQDSIPDEFLQSDLQVKDRRHLIFATTQQLLALNRARTWYVDGTFKLIREPFKQLLSINAFIKSGNCIKQVPLIFVMMSEKKVKRL